MLLCMNIHRYLYAKRQRERGRERCRHVPLDVFLCIICMIICVPNTVHHILSRISRCSDTTSKAKRHCARQQQLST